MTVNKNSSVYIVIYATIMVVVVAAVLATAAMVLQPIQNANIAVETKGAILTVAGMSAPTDQIEKVVNIFKETGCPFELMHCVGTYPMDPTHANLKCIETLRDRFKCKVGYSGHEVGLAVSYGAAALGITSLERHITLDRSMYGSDQAASVEPNGLMMLVGTVRKIQAAMGDGVKRILPEEMKVAEKLRAHIKL